MPLMMPGPDDAAAGMVLAAPLSAAAQPDELEAVFVYARRPADGWEPFRAAAQALVDGGLSAHYGVVTARADAGRVIIARHDGAPLPSPKSPQWRKLARLVREAVGPSPTGR